jgi:ATP-binding cassette subfamily B (MDR/TAP) protein 1
MHECEPGGGVGDGEGGTRLIVMHKVPIMRCVIGLCLVSEGVVGEEGMYEELMARKGVFVTLASGGEWAGFTFSISKGSF